MNICKQCKKQTSNPKFCSRSCSITYNNKLHAKKGRDEKNYRNCGQCNKLYYGYGKFCSKKCYLENRRENTENDIKKGVASIKRIRDFYIKRNPSCGCCGIKDWLNKPINLELHHIDGDITNNDPKNLILLCPNCHSQTPTYKSKNSKNIKGKSKRIERYLKSIKSQ